MDCKSLDSWDLEKAVLVPDEILNVYNGGLVSKFQLSKHLHSSLVVLPLQYYLHSKSVAGLFTLYQYDGKTQTHNMSQIMN